jgi:hypothetical protein
VKFEGGDRKELVVGGEVIVPSVFDFSSFDVKGAEVGGGSVKYEMGVSGGGTSVMSNEASFSLQKLSFALPVVFFTSEGCLH